MRATGIVRRIDDLGRVVIPREIRKYLHIREGDPLEIFTDNTGGVGAVCFRKYEPNFIQSLHSLADRIDDEMEDGATIGQRREVHELFNEIAKILKEWEEEINR